MNWSEAENSPVWVTLIQPFLVGMRNAVVDKIATEPHAEGLRNLQGQLLAISAMLAMPESQAQLEAALVANQVGMPNQEELENGTGRVDELSGILERRHAAGRSVGGRGR